MERGETNAPIDGSERRRAAEPERLEGDHRSRDRGLVDATERRQDGGGPAGELVLRVLREAGDELREAWTTRGRERERARAPDVVHHRRHRDLRERRAIGRQLARHRDGEDRRVHRAPRGVVVRVSHFSHAEESGRAPRREIDQVLRDALDAAREHVLARGEVVEEPTQDHDGRRVVADDALLDREVLDLDAAEARGLSDRTQADLRRRRAEPAPFLRPHRGADGLREREELRLRDVARDGELGAAAPLEQLRELRGRLVGGARPLEELSRDEDRLLREEDVHARPRAQAVLADDLVRLLELAHERLVGEIVELRLPREPVERDEDSGAKLAGVLPPDEIARVVGHDVEAHRHEGTPSFPIRAAIFLAAAAAAARVSSLVPHRVCETSRSVAAVAADREHSPRASAASAREVSRSSEVKTPPFFTSSTAIGSPRSGESATSARISSRRSSAPSSWKFGARTWRAIAGHACLSE